MATWMPQNSRPPSLAIAIAAQVTAYAKTAPIKCSSAFMKFACGPRAGRPDSRSMQRRLDASIRCRCGGIRARDMPGIARRDTKTFGPVIRRADDFRLFPQHRAAGPTAVSSTKRRSAMAGYWKIQLAASITATPPMSVR